MQIKVRILFFFLMFVLAFNRLYSAVVVSNYNSYTSLAGEWKYIRSDNPEYKNTIYDDTEWQTVAVPSSINNDMFAPVGIVWYRKYFVLSDSTPPSELGIRLGVIDSADEVYINGMLIGKSGNIEAPTKEAYDKIRLYQIPTSILQLGETNTVAIRVRTLYRGGIVSGDVYIGQYRTMIKSFFTWETINLLFIVAYLIVAIYFLFFYIRRPSDTEKLWFFLSLIAISIYVFFRSQWKHTLGMEFFWAKRLEYSVLYIVASLFFRFVYDFFFCKTSSTGCEIDITEPIWIKKLVNITSIVFLGMGVVMQIVCYGSPDFRLWTIFNIKINYPIILLIAVSLLFIIIYKVTQKNKDALLVLLGAVPFATATVIDILTNLGYFDIPRLLPYGLAFFILSIALTLTNRFVELNFEIERANIKLKELDEMKDQFISNISHEVKTPLTSILGNIEMLISGDIDKKDDIEMSYEAIFSNTNLAANLMDEILLTTHIELGNMLIKFIPVNLGLVIKKAVRKNIILSDKNDIAISYDDIGDVMVHSNAQYLETVFTQVIENAVLFNTPGGNCSVFIHEMDDDSIVVAVSDTGIGISEYAHKKIFDKFFRGDSSTTYSISGTGLGLYLCKRLLELMEGFIDFESREGKGSIFYIKLPLMK